jgi:Glycosyltransferase family 87
VLPPLSVAVNIAALLAAVWFTFGGLGYRRGLTRLCATLLTAVAVFWTEPVIRTLYLGQVNLVLMALIIWDLGQPDTRRSGPCAPLTAPSGPRRHLPGWTGAGRPAGPPWATGPWPGPCWSCTARDRASSGVCQARSR